MSFIHRNGDCVVEGDFDLLNKLVKELGKDYYVDVGILGQERDINGLTYAARGAVHEFGSPSRKIPERSFIRAPLRDHQQEIAQTVQANAKNRLESGDIKGIFSDIGRGCVEKIDAAFDTSGDRKWAPLSENYKIRPSGKLVADDSKPLIDEGKLRGYIQFKVGVN